MILAAGLGTRLKPWTEHHPKALALVNEQTLLEKNVRYLQQFGIYDIVINVHHFANQIIACINQHNGWGSHFEISDETHTVLDTGGGIKKAAPLLAKEKDFLVMNVDILTNINLQQLIDKHQTENNIATLAVSERNSHRCLLFDENTRLCGWKNKKTGKTIIASPQSPLYEKAFSGIHIINTSIFQHMPQEDKFSIIDTYLSLATQHNIQGFDHTGEQLLDVGTPERLAKAALFFK